MEQTTIDLLPAIRQRRSSRDFADRPLDSGVLDTLLEAARWAPSSVNEQPWRYLVATADQPQDFARFVSCLNPGNQVWASQAPLILLSVAKTQFTYNGKPNRHALYDTGQANMSLLIQATALGLTGRQMGGFDMAKTIETFQIPEGYEPVVFIALGYPGDGTRLPEEVLAKEAAPRTRKPIDDIRITNFE